ncbi:hypothetical protein [Allohahella marinimesophila]|uniref:Uncharacterized protein n=1 Tax=Allohahella marinimesophila TaxID=1054972 RepID=A0ABP7P1Z9_9GAMM
MVEFIAHRINQRAELANVSKNFGVELDLRDCEKMLHLSHDPFTIGESFDEYARAYDHGTMILNIKSERIELRAIELIKRHKIQKYFFLDSSFPMLKLLSDLGENNLAVRFSEYEGMDTLRAMRGRARWVWVDCFSRLPLTDIIYQELKDLNYNICIVSPELQGQDEKLEDYAAYMRQEKIVPDAICSKVYNFERWKKFFEFPAFG